MSKKQKNYLNNFYAYKTTCSGTVCIAIISAKERVFDSTKGKSLHTLTPVFDDRAQNPAKWEVIIKENVLDPGIEIVVIGKETVIAIVEIEEIVIEIGKEIVTEKEREIAQGVDQKNVVVQGVLRTEGEKNIVNLTLKVVFYRLL